MAINLSQGKPIKYYTSDRITHLIGNGILTFYDSKIKDSKKGGYGEITVSKIYEVSSNTGVVKIINDNYKKNPQDFVDRLYKYDAHL